MKKAQKEIIEVETGNFKVGKKYYSFDYKIWRNGKIWDSGWYDSSHSRSATSIRKWLKDGWATEIIIEHKF